MTPLPTLPSTTNRPYLSVVMPTHQSQLVLPRSLAALAASTLPRAAWELIVVDDASSDDSPLIAAEYADAIVRLPGKARGPAYARNRGSELARGEIIVFVDADVCVHADALARFADVFASSPDVGAVFGSYDANPPAPGFVSQYRNLLHHYHHQQNRGEAQTFWAGCGAVRAEVFAAAEMYDEWHFARPQIEDIELGNRIHALGHRILLLPEIQCRHLKRWTLRDMVATDLRDRGVPWVRLLVAQSTPVRPRRLNVTAQEKVCTALSCLMVVLTMMALVLGETRIAAAAAVCLVPILVVNRHFYAFFERTRGFWFALRVVPMHVLYYCLNGVAAASGWFMHQLLGGPTADPIMEAFSEVGIQTWPPIPTKRRSGWW